MSTYIQNRDAGGTTDERGHDHFQGNVWIGNIVDGLTITPDTTPDQKVLITPGDIKIPYQDYNYFAWSNSNVSLSLHGPSTMPTLNNTEAAILAYIDLSVIPNSSTVNNPGCLKFTACYGTTTSMPTADQMQSSVGGNNPYVVLGRVIVEPTITASQISNLAKHIQSLGMLQSAYPVGSIYMNALDQRDPSQIIGIGTWKLYGAGRNIIGVNPNDSDYSSAGKTGGTNNASISIDQLPYHQHSGSTSTDGNHAHTLWGPGWLYSAQFQNPRDRWWDHISGYTTQGVDGNGAHNHHFWTNWSGGNQTHSNIQPYNVIKIWERIA